MPLTAQSVSIPAEMSLSTTAALSGPNQQVIGLILPPAWDGAGLLTFRWSIDNVSWHDIFDRTGKEMVFTWVSAAFIPIQSQYGFSSFPYVQIRSGSRALPIIQKSTRQFTIISQ